MSNAVGKVWLVGAGPGDAGLFTLKGAQVLADADVVVYDRLAGQEVLGMMPDGALKIDVGKCAGSHPIPQGEINNILLKHALAGKKVVRLKGGDPFLFGRGGEELELLVQNGIPFEVVPGIPSAISVPAYAGIPVTHREYCSSVHIITGHAKTGGTEGINFNALAQAGGTLVFLMGLSNLREICTGLLGVGMRADMPAAVLEKGTTAAQRRVVSTLEKLYGAAVRENIQSPAIIVVGEVCGLAETMSWAENRPLAGLRLVNVRPAGRNSTLTQMLRSRGAEVVEYPCIRTTAIENNQALNEAFGKMGGCGWIVLTSPFGAEAFFKKLWEAGMDVRDLAGIRFAAIGSATARVIEEHGIRVAYVPGKYSAKDLGLGLAEHAAGQKVLIARAREGSPELCAALDGAVTYDDIPLYETVYEQSGNPAANAVIAEGAFDYVLFTSASTVRGFAAAAGSLKDVKAVCIGEETARQARESGVRVWVAQEATLVSMVETLIALKSEEK